MSLVDVPSASATADPAAPAEAPKPWSARTRFRVATASLGVIAGAAAVIGSAVVFPYLSQNSDEGAYLTQAGALRSGDLVPDAPSSLPQLFQPWFSVLRDGHFVFKYAPVHAATLAAVPDALGGTRTALGLIAAAAVLLIVALAREVGAGRRAALIAGAIFALSPVVIVQSMTYLPYLGNLVFLLAFAVAVRRGARLGSAPLVAVGGLALGLAFWARPYDALLFAAPMVVWQAARCHRGQDRTTLAAFVGWLSLGAIPGLIGFLGYNAVATGNMLRLPFRLQEQSDNLGFGGRRTNRLEPLFEYTVRDAWRATRENARLLLTWSFGSVMLVVLGAYGTFTRPVAKCRWLLLGWLVVWPVGFFFFWGSFSYIFRWDGGRYLGPYYYLPMLVPLAIGAGIGIQRTLEHARWVVALFAIAAVALALPVLVETIDGNLARTEHRRAVADAVDAAVDGAAGNRADRGTLVLIPGVWGPYLQHPFSFLRNRARYDGNRVYAIETGNLDLALASDFPGRALFAVSLPEGYHDGTTPVDSPIWVERQDMVRGAAVTVGIHDLVTDEPLALRLTVGDQHVDAPVGADGSARFTLFAGSDGLVITNGAGDAETVGRVGKDDRIQVSIVRPLANGSVQTLERRLAPLAVEPHELTVMWPGTVQSSVFQPSGGSSWSATPAVADPGSST